MEKRTKYTITAVVIYTVFALVGVGVQYFYGLTIQPELAVQQADPNGSITGLVASGMNFQRIFQIAGMVVSLIYAVVVTRKKKK